MLAASLASVNAAPDLPPRLVRHLSHLWTFLEAMGRLPRRLAPCRRPSPLHQTPQPLLHLSNPALRLQQVRLRALSQRPLHSSHRSRLLLYTHRQPRPRLLASQSRLFLLRQALLLRLLRPPRAHLRPLLTVVPHPLPPRVVGALRARVDHTSRPSQAMAPKAPAGQARINGSPSRLCGRSTKTS